MSTPGPDGQEPATPDASRIPAYGSPSSPSYGKYGQGEAVRPEPSAPPQPGPAGPVPGWGAQDRQPGWGQGAGWEQSGHYQQVPRRPLPVGRLREGVVVLSVLYTVATWAAVLVAPRERESLSEALAADRGGGMTLTAADVLTLLAMPVMIGTWVITSVWLTRAWENAVLVAPGSQRRTAGWVWFGWALPPFYLWFPKQILDDTARATGRAVGDARPVATNRYWAVWVTSIVLGVAQAVVELLLGEPALARGLGVADAVVMTVALVLWIQVVLGLSDVQDRLAARGAVAPGPTLAP